MKIKKGDKVKVIAGSARGTISEVTAVFPKENKVIVEGVNVAKIAQKPSQINPDGGIVSKEMPIHVSNVMLYDSKAKTASRVGFRIEKDVKVRYFKKSGTTVKGGKK